MEEGKLKDDDVLIEEPFFESIDKLDEETILKEEIFTNYIFCIDNIIKREKEIAKLQKKARELKVKPIFDKALKQYEKEYKKEQKEIEKKQKLIEETKNNKTDFSKCIDGTEKGYIFSQLKLDCGKWIVNEEGVYKIEYNYGQPIKIEASPIPIVPVERYKNIETNEEKVKLAFFKDNYWQEIIVEKNTIISKAKILQLGNKGLEVNENNAKDLITYLSDILISNKFEVKKEITHLGWIKGNKFSPYSYEYFFHSDSKTTNVIYSSIKESGNYDIWKDLARRLREYSKANHLLTVASLASPFIGKVKINSFFVHLWGTSSKGKTLALMLAMSIWGYPDYQGNGIIFDFNAAQGGLDETLGLLGNIPFASDEFGKYLKTKSSKDANSLIYYIAGGKGRTRAKAEGGLRDILNWNFISLTNGEEPLTMSVDEGMLNRIIDINENKSLYPENMSGNKIANILYENYGFAGKEMITEIYNKDELSEKFNKNLKKFSEIDTSGKQINTFSLLKAIDDITAYKIFRDEPLSYEDYEKYIVTTKDLNESDKIIQIIIDEANRNINNFSFFTVGQRPEKPTGQVWGKIEKTTDGKGVIMYYYWIPSVLKEVLEKHDINFDAKKSKLAQSGYLERQNGQYSVNTLMSEGYQRMIKIKNVNFEIDKEKQNEDILKKQ